MTNWLDILLFDRTTFDIVRDFNMRLNRNKIVFIAIILHSKSIFNANNFCFRMNYVHLQSFRYTEDKYKLLAKNQKHNCYIFTKMIFFLNIFVLFRLDNSFWWKQFKITLINYATNMYCIVHVIIYQHPFRKNLTSSSYNFVTYFVPKWKCRSIPKLNITMKKSFA